MRPVAHAPFTHVALVVLLLLAPAAPAHGQGLLSRLMGQAATQPTAQPTRFASDNGLFELTLPPGWTLARDTTRPGTYTGVAGDLSAGLLTVNVWATEPGVSPRTLARVRRNINATALANFRTLGETPTPLGALEGSRIVHEGVLQNGVRLRTDNVVARNDQVTVSVTLTGPANRFDTVRPAFEEMVKSFQLTGKLFDSPDGKYRVVLPTDWNPQTDAKSKDRLTVSLGPDAGATFDVYHSSPQFNAAKLMEVQQRDMAQRHVDFRTILERPAKPGVVTDFRNGQLLVCEYTHARGGRWRVATWYCEDGNFIYVMTYYAKTATYMSTEAAVQRVAGSFDYRPLVATDAQPDVRSVAAASGDFEMLIPNHWLLNPRTAEKVPHLFVNYQAVEEAGMDSVPQPEAFNLDAGLDGVITMVARGAPDATPVKQSDAKLGPLAAREKVVEYTHEGIAYRAVICGAAHDGRVYYVWMSTPAERYDFIRPTLDKAIASFKLIPPVDPEKVTAYENKAHRFRLNYPDVLRPIGTFGGEIVRLAVRPAGPATQYLDNVVIGPETLAKDDTLTLEKAAANFETTQVRFLTGPRPKGWDDATVGGLKAKRIVFDMTVQGLDGGPVLIRKMAYVVVRDGRAYSIRVQARVPNFNVFFATAQKVLDSFQWTAGE